MDSKNTSYVFMEGGIERAGEQAGRPGRKLLERYRVAWTRVWTMMTSKGLQRIGWVRDIFRCKFGRNW